jgi:Protein of unknown function (DUF1569)
MPERRKLTFATLSDAVADAENLLAKGYDKAGNWDLAQVCGHLSEWLRFPIDGFPKVPLLLRPVLALVRATIGRNLRAKVLANGFEPGTRTLPRTVFVAGNSSDAAAVAKLKETVERFEAHAGPIHPSPLFGPMTKDEARALQLRHLAHHLSFLVPKA